MDFHKMIFDFCKFCNEIGQKHFVPYLKNKVFLTQSLQSELQELSFKFSLKNQMAQVFLKNEEISNFGTLYSNLSLFLKLNCISFFRLKILSHMQKNIETSHIEILRKVVNRQTYGQTIHALNDPCVMYDLVS